MNDGHLNIRDAHRIRYVLYNDNKQDKKRIFKKDFNQIQPEFFTYDNKFDPYTYCDIPIRDFIQLDSFQYMVKYNKDTVPYIKYKYLVPILINEIHDLNDEIDTLKLNMKSLQKDIDKLKEVKIYYDIRGENKESNFTLI